MSGIVSSCAGAQRCWRCTSRARRIRARTTGFHSAGSSGGGISLTAATISSHTTSTIPLRMSALFLTWL